MGLWESLKKLNPFNGAEPTQADHGMAGLTLPPVERVDLPRSVKLKLEAYLQVVCDRAGEGPTVHCVLDSTLPLSRPYRMQVVPDDAGRRAAQVVVSCNSEFVRELVQLYEKGEIPRVRSSLMDLRSDLMGGQVPLQAYHRKVDRWHIKMRNGEIVIDNDMRQQIDALCCQLPTYFGASDRGGCQRDDLRGYLNAAAGIECQPYEEFWRGRYEEARAQFYQSFGADKLAVLDKSLGINPTTGSCSDSAGLNEALRYVTDYSVINGYNHVDEADRLERLCKSHGVFSELDRCRELVVKMRHEGAFDNVSEIPTGFMVSLFRDSQNMATSLGGFAIKVGPPYEHHGGIVSLMRNIEVILSPEMVDLLLNADRPDQVQGILSDIRKALNRILPKAA